MKNETYAAIILLIVIICFSLLIGKDDNVIESKSYIEPYGTEGPSYH